MRTLYSQKLGVALALSMAMTSVAFASECSGEACKGPADKTIAGNSTEAVVETKPKVETVTTYKTVNKVQNVTKVKDVYYTKYVETIQRKTTVTTIQPIVRKSVVTTIQPIVRTWTEKHEGPAKAHPVADKKHQHAAKTKHGHHPKK